MTYYTSLSPSLMSIISGLMFISALSVMALCIYKYISTDNIILCIKEIISLIAYILLLSYITAASEKGEIYWEVPIPYCILIITAAIFIIYSVSNICMQYIHNRNVPSPASIKQALDNLDSGICFSDDSGRIVLINHKMTELLSEYTGRIPETIYEINDTLSTLGYESPSLYHFPKSEVWDFQSTKISESFTQVTALNVTELYKINSQLADSNEELQNTNEQIGLMMNRLADRIREQETLNLRMKVHNDIGTSLIAISNINEDIDIQLKNLQNAVSYFSTFRQSDRDSLDELINEADNMNIKLVPKDAKIRVVLDDNNIRPFIAAAIRECVTNTIKHASGTTVYVSATCTDSLCSVTITNDGKSPKDNITEGGGLTNLRNKIEQIGGTMTITSVPTFTLNITVPS